MTVDEKYIVVFFENLFNLLALNTDAAIEIIVIITDMNVLKTLAIIAIQKFSLIF